jgi:hypothetical protein
MLSSMALLQQSSDGHCSTCAAAAAAVLLLEVLQPAAPSTSICSHVLHHLQVLEEAASS